MNTNRFIELLIKEVELFWKLEHTSYLDDDELEELQHLITRWKNKYKRK